MVATVDNLFILFLYVYFVIKYEYQLSMVATIDNLFILFLYEYFGMKI